MQITQYKKVGEILKTSNYMSNLFSLSQEGFGSNHYNHTCSAKIVNLLFIPNLPQKLLDTMEYQERSKTHFTKNVDKNYKDII